MAEKPITSPDLGPIQLQVGRGITAFATLEFAVGLCFASMLEPAPRERSITIFNAARSFEARLKMIDALALVALNSAQQRNWRTLANKIGRRKLMRDKLAHWMAGSYPGIRKAEDIKKMKAGLLPPIARAEHWQVVWNASLATVKPITEKQLMEFHDQVVTLTSALFTFSQKIMPVKGLDE